MTDIAFSNTVNAIELKNSSAPNTTQPAFRGVAVQLDESQQSSGGIGYAHSIAVDIDESDEEYFLQPDMSAWFQRGSLALAASFALAFPPLAFTADNAQAESIRSLLDQ